MKLSVYVPDELAERLAVVKDDLNVSEVCQAALTVAVSAAEAARLGDERQRIIERLKRTRTAEQQAFDRGLAKGRRWAADKASLDELRAFASPAGAEAFDHAANQVPDPAEAKGFHQGVREVWDSVKSEFEE